MQSLGLIISAGLAFSLQWPSEKCIYKALSTSAHAMSVNDSGYPDSLLLVQMSAVLNDIDDVFLLHGIAVFFSDYNRMIDWCCLTYGEYLAPDREIMSFVLWGYHFIRLSQGSPR